MSDRRLTSLVLIALLIMTANTTSANPSILFCSPDGTRTAHLDLTYAQELHEKGFEIDYIEQPEDFIKLNSERVAKYNVLVIYTTPNAYKVCNENVPSDPQLRDAFVSMVDDYVSKGGGVLLMPEELNVKMQHVGALTAPWGAIVTGCMLSESNPDYVGRLTNASYKVPLQYADSIPDSPVSEGVNGIWYPTAQYHNGSMTNAIVVDDNWQVVVKASDTAQARTFGSEAEQHFGDMLKGIEVPGGSVDAPAIIAIRKYGKGRIALVSSIPQFTVGSGTGFIFGREVLSKGVKGLPSDFGRLLENIYGWLAEPSEKSGAVGGYATRMNILVAPNERELVKEFNEWTFWSWEYDVVQWHVPPKYGQIFKGLIGARSAFSDGEGTVADYKAAADKAGLDFLVFLENFDELSEADYNALVEECTSLSDSRVKLIPGFTMRSNIGNHTICFSEDSYWPGEDARTGPGKKLLNIQPQDDDGRFLGYNTASSFHWQLNHMNDKRNTGYYNWAESGDGMPMQYQRNVALAGIRFYRGGQLVEDMTDDYLTTLQSTMPPTPVSVNEVHSPAALIREVESGNALTYVQARSVHTIMQDALRWSHTVDGMNVFVSDGPIIRAWPTCYRPMSFGAEEFVTAPAVMESPVHVTSEVGLKAIRIYNGRELFRYFRCDGAREFRKTLVLNGTIQRSMVLIAEDIEGGKAVSFARRSYKYDNRSIYYCSDHTNEGGMRSFHGPGGMPVCPPPQLHWDIAGHTWDGGPLAVIPLVHFSEARPQISTDKGDESGTRFDQYPITETADEGSIAVASVQEDVFDDRVIDVVNAWHTMGPHGDASKLIEYTLRFKEYLPPTIGVPISDLPIRSVRTGIRACVFTQEIAFKQDMTINELKLIQNGGVKPMATPTLLIIGRAPDRIEETLDPGSMSGPKRIRLARGDWFAAFSPKTSCTHIFVLNSAPVILEVSNYNQNANWLVVYADLEGKQVSKGDTHVLELVSLNSSLDLDIPTAEAVNRYISFVSEPDGMTVTRGSHLSTPGFLDIQPDDGAIEISIPRMADPFNITVPLRVPGLNRNWSAGLWQKSGYVKGYYGSGENRYRGIGIDFSGRAHIPLYIDKAETTHIVAGHPVIADERGAGIAINVMHLFDNPHQWHVAVNNITDQPVTTRLKQAMDLPQFDFEEREIMLQPGEYRVLGAKAR